MVGNEGIIGIAAVLGIASKPQDRNDASARRLLASAGPCAPPALTSCLVGCHSNRDAAQEHSQDGDRHSTTAHMHSQK
jgi:hypothetical protein